MQKFGKLSVYDSEEIAPPIGEYWAARRETADKLRALQEYIQTTQLNADDLNQINKALSGVITTLPDRKKLYGREDWLAAEEYGHNGVIHSETTPIIGIASPIAPGLSIWFDGKEVKGKVTFNWMFEGGNQRAHGGCIAAVFDEFMATAMALNKMTGVTAYIKTDYLKYTPINKELRLRAYIAEHDRNKVFVNGEMWADDVMTAKCEALFIEKEAIPKRG